MVFKNEYFYLTVPENIAIEAFGVELYVYDWFHLPSQISHLSHFQVCKEAEMQIKPNFGNIAKKLQLLYVTFSKWNR